MEHLVNSIGQLEKLINNREYVEDLKIFLNGDINYLLKYLTDLKCLEFGIFYNSPIDFSTLTNLTKLTFHNYNHQTDFSMLTNLSYLHFGSRYNQETDLKNLTNLTKLVFGWNYNKPTDLSTLTNLTSVHFENRNYNKLTNFTNCDKLESLNSVRVREGKLLDLQVLFSFGMKKDEIKTE